MLSSLRDTFEDSACHMWVLCMPHVRILHVTCEFFACHMWRCCTSLVRALSITCDDSAPHIWRCCASHGRTLHLTCKDSPHHMWGLCASHVTWQLCASHVKMLRITWEDSAPHMWRLCASHMRTLSHMWGLCVPHYYGLGGAGEEQLQGGLKEMCWTDLCLWLVVRRKQMVHKTLLQICKGQFVGLLGCKVRILLSVNVLYFYALHGSKWTSIWAWCFVLMVNQKSQWNKMEVYLHYKKYIKYYL